MRVRVRVAWSVVVAMTSVLCLQTLAMADGSPGQVGSGDSGVEAIDAEKALEIVGERGGRSANQAEKSAPSAVNAKPPEFWAYEPAWGTQPETGEACIDLRYRANVEPNSETAIEWERQTLQMTADPRLDGAADRWCDAAAAAAAPTPTLQATGFVRQIPLPQPQLAIDPGFALTGMPAYLVIGNQLGFTVTEDLEGWGPMQVDFTPTSFEVDWGDGTVENISDGRTGVRWNGPEAQQISHVYVDSDRHRGLAGDNVVTVTSTWSADWSVAGFTGTVTGMIIDETFELPVREYRAVRGNPSGDR